MPKKSEQIKQIKKEIKDAEKEIKKVNRTIEELTIRLSELEVYESSSEEEVSIIKEGDRVKAINEPHRGRTGTVIAADSYWVQVKADWEIVLRNGKTSKTFKKARHNLQLINDGKE